MAVKHIRDEYEPGAIKHRRITERDRRAVKQRLGSERVDRRTSRRRITGSEFSKQIKNPYLSQRDFTGVELERGFYMVGEPGLYNYIQNNPESMRRYPIKMDKSSARGLIAGGLRLDYMEARNTDFTGANFRETKLRHAHLNGARLTGCNFRDADLSDADISYAVVDGADFTGADMRRIRDEGVNYANAVTKNVKR